MCVCMCVLMRVNAYHGVMVVCVCVCVCVCVNVIRFGDGWRSGDGGVQNRYIGGPTHNRR
jgi:hypothetical protein